MYKEFCFFYCSIQENKILKLPKCIILSAYCQPPKPRLSLHHSLRSSCFSISCAMPRATERGGARGVQWPQTRRVARIWKRGGYFERVRSAQTTLTRIFIDLESVSDGLSEIWDEMSRKDRIFKGFFRPKLGDLQKKKKKKGLRQNSGWFFGRNPKFKRFFRPNLGDLQKKKKKKKVFAKIQGDFSPNFATSNVWGGALFVWGGLFSIFHRKSASKAQKTCDFAYFTSQRGGARAPPAPPWLRYCLRPMDFRGLAHGLQEGRWLQRAQQRAHELERGPSKWPWEISMWGLKTFFFWDHQISTGNTVKISVKAFFFWDHIIIRTKLRHFLRLFWSSQNRKSVIYVLAPGPRSTLGGPGCATTIKPAEYHKKCGTLVI